MKLPLVTIATLLFSPLGVAQDDAQELHRLVNTAVQTSALAGPTGRPFHLKVRVFESQNRERGYDAQFELWWISEEKWRREVKSSAFSQTAIRNGDRYSEQNSAEFLPWWIHVLSV